MKEKEKKKSAVTEDIQFRKKSYRHKGKTGIFVHFVFVYTDWFSLTMDVA